MMPAPTESPAEPEAAAAPPEAAANEPPPAAEDTWSAPAAAEPVQEWQPEAPAGDWQEVRKPDAEALPEAPPPADWGALRSGPDWSAAPANAAPAQEQSWDAAPPPAQEPKSTAVPAAAPAEEWTPPAPVATPAWSSPAGNAMADEAWSEPANEPAPAPAAKPAWNQAAVGASALEQLDSEPPPPEPGAAKELFGSLPEGGLLGGSEEGENDLCPPEELASPEEVLRPVSIDHDDPDLPSPTGEPARTKAQPLAAWKPAVAPGLAVNGEHRVAVHTRGGRTLRGTLRDVDLSKSQFAFVPQGGGEVEAIYRADVKAIFFMLAPGEPPHGGDGAKVKVTFADGRIIEGTRDGADAKHGFFLVPSDAARTNTLKIYVSREAISEIADS